MKHKLKRFCVQFSPIAIALLLKFLKKLNVPKFIKSYLMPNNITRAKDKSKNERDDTLKE